MQTKENAIRVLLADDHPIVREGLITVVNAQADMVVVAEAENGKQAVEAFRKHRPDVTLMDLRLPEMDGVQATAAIRKDFSNARIIVLTTYSGDEFIYRALEAGARAYLLKTTPKKELLETIRVVHQGQRRIPPEVAVRLAERIPVSELTPREAEVLKLIIKGKSNKQIADLLHITESTVKYHVNLILAKLGVSDRTEAATAALQRGIIVLD